MKKRIKCMNSIDKLFLLDAYALIYRAYYAFIKNPRINSKGFNTSAILGFVNTLEEVLKKENPTHIGVAFDPSGPTFRHEAYEQYKAQREETPEAIRLSVPIIKDIIRAYRIPILEVSGYEADDVIGTLATEAGRQGITTYMMTPDKDYGQLVSDRVFMYRPKHTGGFEIMGTEEVKTKFSIQSTEQVIDMLGLMGDASDNIPGCPGVGEKTAQKLIAEFGSIENLLEHTDQLKGALKTKVETNREMITFSKFLATIKTDVPIQLDMDSLVREEPNEEELRKIFEELEFRTLIDRVLKKGSGNSSSPTPTSPVPDLFAGTLFAQPQTSTPENSAPIQGDLFANFAGEGTGVSENSNLTRLEMLDVDYQLIDTEDKRAEIIQKLLTSEILSIDTETTGTEPMDAELVGMSFSDAENRAYYVPVPAEREEVLKIVNEFRPLFENEKSMKVGQNIKYDMIILQNYGVQVKGKLFDTMLAHYVLQPELRHNMDYLAEIYLHYQTIHIDELIGARGKNQKNMRDLSPEDVYRYACEDADVTLKLKNVLEKELKKQGAEHLFYEIEMPLVPVLVNIESNGVLLDTEALKQSSQHFTVRLQEIEKEIYEMAGETFNISSAKQVGEVLFDKLKIVEKAKKTKTGQYVTSEEVLQSYRSKHDIIGKILEYRGLKKLLSTYIDALPQLINPRTGRIHTSFNQAVTATGRLSSSNPNLQNIPVRGPLGKRMRSCFIAGPGRLLVSADYSQVELRVLAHVSQDPALLEAFRNGEDIHARTAALVYDLPPDQVNPDQRRNAKTINFGLIYGMGAQKLAQELKISTTQAKDFIARYFERLQGLKEFYEGVEASARKHGFVTTLGGRRRLLPDINSASGQAAALARRQAINTVIQGSAADIIKLAMLAVARDEHLRELDARLLLQVHDELLLEVPADAAEEAGALVARLMQDVCPAGKELSVPLLVDWGTGHDWGAAH